MEELKFKKFNGEHIPDIGKYVKDWISKYPYCTITIGCDSQEYRHFIKYAISICMHEKDEYGIGHGAHVVYATVINKSRNMKSDLYTKLWGEAELSIETAKLIEDCGKTITIHLDYNSKASEYSNVLYSTGIGYVKGMGFECLGKPLAWGASCVSDRLCR